MGIAAALALVCLGYTYGRGAWLGTAASLLFLVVFFPKENFRVKWGKIILGAGSIVVILAVAMGLPSPYPTAKLAAKRVKSFVTPRETTVATRLEIWKNTISLVRERPFLGWGLENFGYVFLGHRSLKLVRLEGEKGLADRPHNQTLYLASSLGLPGLLAYFWLILTFLRRSLRFLRQLDFDSKLFALGPIAAVIGYLVQAEFSFSLVGVTPLVWVLMGLIMGSERENPPLIVAKSPLLSSRSSLKMALGLLILIPLLVLGYLSYRPLLADYYYRMSLTHPQQLKAIETLNRAAALNPYQNLYRLELGRTFYQRGATAKDRGSLDQAIAVYNDGLRFNPREIDILFNLGNVYNFLGSRGDHQMLDKALEAYQRAIEVDPLFSTAHWSMGFVYFQKNNFNLGIEYYKKAVEISPDNPTLRYDIGLAYEEMGEEEKAKRSHLAALKLKPGFKPAREALKRLK